jgi:hypothetical protein
MSDIKLPKRFRARWCDDLVKMPNEIVEFNHDHDNYYTLRIISSEYPGRYSASGWSIRQIQDRIRNGYVKILNNNFQKYKERFLAAT